MPALRRHEAKELLATADKTFNAMSIGEACGKCVVDGHSLAECENMLRELGSNTYLVAWPVRFMPPGLNAWSLQEFKKCDHALWVCLHGIEERDARLKEWGNSDAIENLELLETTGFSIMANEIRRMQ